MSTTLPLVQFFHIPSYLTAMSTKFHMICWVFLPSLWTPSIRPFHLINWQECNSTLVFLFVTRISFYVLSQLNSFEFFIPLFSFLSQFQNTLLYLVQYYISIIFIFILRLLVKILQVPGYKTGYEVQACRKVKW